eukprot:CAMPEP_0172530436 /NCGR_PEP_ID=MMETSP1067-20121228/4171_1 /TAXON_ID=265564 ORGANISM="Thalassiosira punctigera, Strain Tpunct2005C2" /NCGR_SAMPLE_ID=MMETSP1067 /ASSEMBLY_ACC=CAM_ASM_000444 /LENGTH=289 /DNA_ID=CAMNT_0013314643 /DNA_START=92 /DNA_END=961 /DNA_ORIENTATION=+
MKFIVDWESKLEKPGCKNDYTQRSKRRKLLNPTTEPAPNDHGQYQEQRDEEEDAWSDISSISSVDSSLQNIPARRRVNAEEMAPIIGIAEQLLKIAPVLCRFLDDDGDGGGARGNVSSSEGVRYDEALRSLARSMERSQLSRRLFLLQGAFFGGMESPSQQCTRQEVVAVAPARPPSPSDESYPSCDSLSSSSSGGRSTDAPGDRDPRSDILPGPPRAKRGIGSISEIGPVVGQLLEIAPVLRQFLDVSGGVPEEVFAENGHDDAVRSLSRSMRRAESSCQRLLLGRGA